MSESYIQYAGGYQKDDIDIQDITKALSDLPKMDDEHGAFWVSILTEDENVIEVNKELQLSFIFDGIESKYQATDLNEVKDFYKLLLTKNFEEIKQKIK